MDYKNIDLDSLKKVQSTEEETDYIKKAPTESKQTKSVFEWVESFVVSLVIIVVLFSLFFGKVKVDGPSMLDTLVSGDQLVISNFCYTPEHGDIVIVSRNPKNLPESNSDKKTSSQPIVKRVIAVEGDTIEIKNKKVYLNGKELDEPYIKDYQKGPHTDGHYLDGKGPQTVPEGCIFVMGDNRDDSHDSRMNDIYMIDSRYVLGKVLFRIFPFDELNSFM